MVFIFTWVGKVTLACDISDSYPLSSKVKHVGSLSQPPASHFFSLKTSPSAMNSSSGYFFTSSWNSKNDSNEWILRLQYLGVSGWGTLEEDRAGIYGF